MTLNYGYLFSIELLHEYFYSQKCNDLELVPAEDCKMLARNLNIQWRTAENRFIAIIKQGDANEPFINPPKKKFFRKFYSESVFRFYIRMKNPVFLNYTNLDLALFQPRRKLYFSNTTKNSASGSRFLSAPIEDYSLNRVYVPGEFIKDPASGTIFENIRKHSLKKKSQLSDGTLWIKKGMAHLSKVVDEHKAGRTYMPGDLVLRPGTDELFEASAKHVSSNDEDLNDVSRWLPRDKGLLQYPTAADSMEFTTGQYQFVMPSAVSEANIVISAFNFDPEKPAFNRAVNPAEKISYDKPVKQININLAGQPPGKYEIKVNKEVRTVYFDPVLNSGDIIGVVEIFNHLPGDDDYALLNDDEKLKYARFQIHFANRRVLWKYIRKDGKAEQITDTGDTGYVFNLDGDDFVSDVPIPLYESVCKTLKLEFSTKDFRMFPLPNPQINRLAKYKKHDYDYLCSELYLNY